MNLLTPAQFRGHHWTRLLDPDLQLLCDAAEIAITARVGPLGTVTDRRRGGGTLLFMSRKAATITSVTERYGDPLGLTDVVLATDDWTLLPDGRTLRREWVGTHRNDRWADDVIVVYTAFDDTAERQRVAIGLVQLDLNNNPGQASERIGDWEEVHVDNSAMNYELEREALLSSLDPNVPWFA